MLGPRMEHMGCRGLQSSNAGSHRRRCKKEREADQLAAGTNNRQPTTWINSGPPCPLVSTISISLEVGEEIQISQEKRRLGQHRPRIGQVEDRPQVGHERHVQVGDNPKMKNSAVTVINGTRYPRVRAPIAWIRLSWNFAPNFLKSFGSSFSADLRRREKRGPGPVGSWRTGSLLF